MRPLGPFARFGPAMRQVQRQTQTLAMTPQLRQAIQLLQLSNLELNAWLEDALETNPLLARDDGVSEGGVSEGGGENGAANGADRQEGAAANGEASSPNGADPAPLDFGDKSNADRAGGDESFDDSDRMGETAAENLWDGDRDAGAGLANWSGRGNGGGEGGEMRDYPQTVADKPPLREHLMQQIRLTIERFLYDIWRTGALMGTKPEEAYFVRCDRTTMSQGDLDNGRLICLIGVAPTKPAEFVIFRIGQWTADASII